jgi:hypothetical protein
MAKKQPRDPFDVSLDDEQRKRLAIFLCEEVQAGLDARAATELDVDYWHALYEQARIRTGRNAPWPDAADLTSYLASEKVDSLHARLVRTVLGVDPIWTVEGIGDASDRAPYVEEFTQVKAESSGLQNTIDKLALISLIEPRGLLEVYEGTERRKVRQRVNAKVVTDPLTGGMVVGEDLQPMTEKGPDGKLIEAGPQEMGVETVVDEYKLVRTGPCERILPYRDSLILPGHARDKDDIWGYGKRLWRRYTTLQQQAKSGMYDTAAVEKMSQQSDRDDSTALNRSGMTVAAQQDTTAEKELWELLVLVNLNDLFKRYDLGSLGKEYDGERWFLCTIHQPTQGLLRIQHDDMEKSRFVPVILFPRTDRVTEGFSFVGHKLITTIEEHTAWRNMAADRSAMQVQAPIKRLQGALWDPMEQPFGPKSIIDVRSMDEVEPMVIPDITAPILQHIQMMERTAERLSGINDVASGSVTSETKTLGEVQMATEQSFVRMDLIVRRFQEALEDVANIRHAIWKRTLAETPEGEAATPTMLSNLESRGLSADQYLPDGKVTAQLLEGQFRFKPHGSVETADPSKRRQDLLQFMQTLPMLAQTFPSTAPMLMNPLAGRAMLREVLRAFRVENQQPFLGSPQQDMQMTQLAQMLQQMMGQMGIPQPAGPPGMAGSPPVGPAAPSPMMPPVPGA